MTRSRRATDRKGSAEKARAGRGPAPKRRKPSSARAGVLHLSRSAVEALNHESLAEHGGLDGVRDEGLLESALGRCVNKAMYEPDASIAELAAALAFGLAKNHPFNDGNKRIALIASFAFLELNGARLTATEAEAYEAIYGLAAGEVSEREMAAWFAAHSKPRRAR
jgi:death-on-curing protein